MARPSPTMTDDVFHSVGQYRKEPCTVNDLIPLAQAHCLARRGSEHRLSEARVRELLPEVPGWEVVEDGHAISKTFRFRNYYETMAFVNALAFMAHREDHHPDLGVHYDRCVVRYSTHDVGGLSENDFICAAKAEALSS
jgi:4a-hydroxytetrahydrobiopterin dehydratase